MLENNDVEIVDGRMVASLNPEERDAWYRLKKELEELLKTPTNTAMVPCKHHFAGTRWVHCLLERTCGKSPCMIAQHQ